MLFHRTLARSHLTNGARTESNCLIRSIRTRRMKNVGSCKSLKSKVQYDVRRVIQMNDPVSIVHRQQLGTGVILKQDAISSPTPEPHCVVRPVGRNIHYNMISAGQAKWLFLRCRSVLGDLELPGHIRQIAFLGDRIDSCTLPILVPTSDNGLSATLPTYIPLARGPFSLPPAFTYTTLYSIPVRMSRGGKGYSKFLSARGTARGPRAGGGRA